jgi:hypothetical protein
MQSPPPIVPSSGDFFPEDPTTMRHSAHELDQPTVVLDLTDEPPRYSEENRLAPFSLPPPTRPLPDLESHRRGKWAASWIPPSDDPIDTPPTRSLAPKETIPVIHNGLSLPYSYRSSTRNERLDKFLQGQPFWLVLYFCFNLALTLYNKMVLVKFPFPYTLTAIHALFGSIGCYILHEQGLFVRLPSVFNAHH